MPIRPLVLISGKDVLESPGGQETYVRAHARAAAQLGFEPHIFCTAARQRVTRSDFGVVHHVGAPVPVAFQGPALARSVVRFLEAHTNGAGPEAIHSFAVWATAGALAGRWLNRRGVRAVTVASAYGTRAYEVAAMQHGVHRHHGVHHRIGYRAWLGWIRAVDDRVERWGYSHSRLVLVNYASVERLLERSYGLNGRIRRVPYATEHAFMNEERGRATPPHSIPLVVSVSRHDPRKGVDVLLRACGELAAEEIPFRARLIGPGRLLESHRRLAADLGLAGRVEVAGPVDDVRPHLADADVFVLPSLAEGSGSVSILEGLRTGTAVVASACDGVPEDLTDGTDALLVPPGDAEALAAALRRLLADPTLRARLGAEGRRTHERRFSAQRLVTALGGVYRDLGVLGFAGA